MYYCCRQMAMYQIEMEEGTPVVPVRFTPTIRLCPGCHIELVIAKHAGLTLNRCVLRFDDMATQTLQLRAERTPGVYSRIVAVRFHTVINSTVADSVWGGYKQPNLLVPYQSIDQF